LEWQDRSRAPFSFVGCHKRDDANATDYVDHVLRSADADRRVAFNSQTD